VKPEYTGARTGGVFAAITGPKHRQKYSVVIACLITAILTGGCYSTLNLGMAGNAVQPFPSDKSITITLLDNAELKVKPFRYVEVREPADFIYGFGEVIDRRNGESAEFRGRIPLSEPVQVDTVVGSSDASWYAKKEVMRDFLYQAPDSSLVRLRSGNFVTVRSEEGTGFYCAGSRIVDGKSSPFGGKIPFEKIRQVECVDFDGWKTAGLVFGIVAVVGAAFAAFAMSTFSLDYGGGGL
jgi:hypothetical protein